MYYNDKTYCGRPYCESCGYCEVETYSVEGSVKSLEACKKMLKRLKDSDEQEFIDEFKQYVLDVGYINYHEASDELWDFYIHSEYPCSKRTLKLILKVLLAYIQLKYK